MNIRKKVRFGSRKLWCVPLVLGGCVEEQQLELAHQELLKQPLKTRLMKVMMKWVNIMRLEHQQRKIGNGKSEKLKDRLYAEEATRESRQTKQDRYAEMRRRKDEEHEARERMLEEEAKAQKAKEEEAAALEFEKWKGEFSVDAEGTTENEVQDGNQDLLSEFVEYIKRQKCIPLEDLAAEFKLRTQECINRITSLENMGRLSGVMDDRGKYIYISQEEMKAVADYIKRQGRVSISHLASKSNQFIDLEPKIQFVEEISNMEEITAT
ncbi:DDRGK domain-containing protein 1 isoform X2 [Manihot esculenta]|uniref:DDRGK domain-containing protein 1 isoform X2 n=1 Tax=Manihot esculenta TaxID=3983 RepID=UPI001CC6322B|nr:DDRGK domain-containing protein 1 isoform X2 [Manihot esculenta]